MTNPAARDILAKNLLLLIAADGGSVRSWSLKRGLKVRMIDRLTKGEHAVTLDKLEEIAAACGLQPWHLLLADFDPHVTADAPITHDERQLLSRLKNLLKS
jgi:hypothetical protein